MCCIYGVVELFVSLKNAQNVKSFQCSTFFRNLDTVFECLHEYEHP